MYKEWKCRAGGRVFTGVLVMAVGVIFLLNNLGIIAARDIFRLWFWPVLLILVGVMQLMRGRRSHD